MDNGKELIPAEQLKKALVEQQRKGNLLNVDVDTLSESQKSALIEKAIEKGFEREVSQAQAEDQFINNKRDIGAAIEAVKEIEQTSDGDYTADIVINTPSGSTELHVNKNTNTVIIVVAVVIGLFILMMLN